jgi:DNA processing protein
MIDTALRTNLLWSALNLLTRARMDALLQVFPDLTVAAENIDTTLLKELGCRPDTITAALERLEYFDVDREEAMLEKSGARLISFIDPEYPFLLRDISDAPAFLYARGNIGILHRPCIGMVGTRRMSAYGRRVAEEFTRAFAGAGVTTVSGLARGIDSVVAETTIDCKGTTVAVLGQGMLTLPSHSADLADRIVQNGGVVLSEFPLTMPPDLFTFPKRNRIIAGLSLATVVLEAPDSSGALITAKLAFDYGREVFAVPGSLFDTNFSGCHSLMALQKAQLADRPQRVLEGIGVIPPGLDSILRYLPANPDEENVYNLLTRMPQSIDDLVQKSGLHAAIINATLTSLELSDVAKNVGAGEWVRA